MALEVLRDPATIDVAGEAAHVRNVIARQEIGPRPSGAATDAGTGIGRTVGGGVLDEPGAAVRSPGETVIGRGLLVGHGGGLRRWCWGRESALATGVGERRPDPGRATGILNGRL